MNIEPIRCSTKLCGNLAVWRRPWMFAGFHNGQWERKCQRCFDSMGASENRHNEWSRVLQPTDATQGVPTLQTPRSTKAE